MAFTEVLLIKPVDGLGAEGEQVRVRAGFARNFLLPQGIALPVNRSNTKYVEALKKAREVAGNLDSVWLLSGVAARMAGDSKAAEQYGLEMPTGCTTVASC
jgi:ribosomal protein L9